MRELGQRRCLPEQRLPRRSTMSTIRGPLVACGLVALAFACPAARAGEVPGELVFFCKKKCNTCQPCGPAPVTACYDPCCDPCRVGPIHRFFRGCHRKPCPKPCAPPCPAPALVVPGPAVVAPVP